MYDHCNDINQLENEPHEDHHHVEDNGKMVKEDIKSLQFCTENYLKIDKLNEDFNL